MLGIFGAAGAIGKSIAAESARRGDRVRVVGRRESVLRGAFGNFHQIVTADFSKPEEASKAAAGLDAIVYAVGVPYTHFELHPVLMRRVLDAAREQGVKKLILISNVYGYGVPTAPLVDETHPRQPNTFKGRMRKEQEDIALAAQSERLRTLVFRLPDFYGAEAEASMAYEIFKAARNKRAAPVLAPIDTPHEWVYTPDVGPVVLDVLGRDNLFGEAYNLAGAGTMATRAFATRIFEEFGETPRLRVLSTILLRIIGLFNPIMRELIEMQYLQSNPVILNDAKLARALGTVKKTSYEDGIKQTVSALRLTTTDASS